MLGSRRLNGDGNINKLQNGRYKLNVRYQGLRKTFYGNTEREVKEKFRKFQIECYEGLCITNMTVAEAIERWLLNVKKIVLKEASYDRLERTFYLYIKEEIGNVRLRSLSTNQCQKVLNKSMERLAYSTVKKVYELLKACLEYYVKTGDIKKNPMDLVVMPREALFEKQTKTIKIPTEQEMKKLFEVADFRLPGGKALYMKSYVLAIKILANSGLRINELMALTEEKVSFESATARIDESISEVKNRDGDEDGPKTKLIVTEPKTRSGTRTIVLNSATIDALKELKSFYHEKGFDSEYYILNSKGNPATAHDVDRTLRTICKAAGIRPFGPHTLRHYFASRCIANGVDIIALSKHLGHSSVSVTMNVYAHLLEKQKDDFKKLLEKI